jgi:hypothetical protein
MLPQLLSAAVCSNKNRMIQKGLTLISFTALLFILPVRIFVKNSRFACWKEIKIPKFFDVRILPYLLHHNRVISSAKGMSCLKVIQVT